MHRMKSSFYARHSVLIAAVSIFLLPFAVVGAIKAKQANKNDVKNWIPKEYEETKVYRDFREHFQGEEFILVSWKGCTIDDTRLELLAQKISPPVEVELKSGASFTAVDQPKAEQILTDPEGEYRFEDAHFGPWRTVDETSESMLIWADDESAGDHDKPNEAGAIGKIVRKHHPLFKTVLTGKRVVDQMTAPPLNLTRAEAVERLAGSLFGPDRRAAALRELADDPSMGDAAFFRRAMREFGSRELNDKEVQTFVENDAPDKRHELIDRLLYEHFDEGLDDRQTCLLATLTEKALADKATAVGTLRQLAVDECAIPPDELHMGGPPVDNVAIDEAGNKSLNLLAGIAVLIGVVVSWASLRDLKLVAIVISAGIYSAILSLSIVWWSRAPVDAILFTMPSLVYVATTSGAIHLVNYYRDVRAGGAPAEGAAGKALHHAALPLSLATGTTAVGLLTLCYTELVPIRIFGFYSAVGVVVSAVLLVFYIPAALEIWKPTLRKQPHATPEDESVHEVLRVSGGFWWRAGEAVAHHHWLVSAACFLVMAATGWGLIYNETSVQLMRLLSPRERIFADYRFLESELGPLVPMEIVVSIPRDEASAGLTFLDRMHLIEEVEQEIHTIPAVGGTMSTVTFARSLDAGQGGLLQRHVQAAVNKTLVRHRDEFLHGDYLRERIDAETGNTDELWRISARVSALQNVDYAQFIGQLKEKVQPVVRAYADEGAKGIDVAYTGVVPLVYKAQHSLMDGLVVGFLTDFTLIVVVMMIACRDWSAGMVLLFPSAFPAVVVFGAMGWIHHFLMQRGWGDLYIDIGYVMAPCVALGVTVDDVVHFMLWYRKGIQEGLNRHQSVMLAYHGCARAMYQSWGVIGIGLAVFALSPFVPTRNFGIMMISMLTVALAGNLLMLPAVLAGPGGAIFAWGIRRRKAKAERRRAARPAHQPAPPEFGQQPVGAGHHGVPNPHLQHDAVRRSVGGR
jgi:predicted RND superfamily exporter protein